MQMVNRPSDWQRWAVSCCGWLLLLLVALGLDGQRELTPSVLPIARPVALQEEPQSDAPAAQEPAGDDMDALEAVKSQATSQQSPISLESLKAEGPFQRPFVLELHGEIDFNTQKFIRSGIERARRAKADLVVLEVDSPGGGAVESMEIADMLANINWAPTVAYIRAEATSGGALSALGCQYIVMQEGATIGDIGVIQYNSVLASFQYAPAKIRSILVAKARALCERHGRAADLAEAMVDEYAAVYRNQLFENQYRLVSMGISDPENPDRQIPKDNGIAKDSLEGGWKLIPETRPERFLTLTNARAEALGVSQGTVSDFESLEKQLGVEGGWMRRSFGVTDRVVAFLNNFWITGLLLVVGLIALFIEISAPGISVGGLVALLCFSLFFWSHFAGGTAGWLEVMLFLLGIVFVLAELFVIPGFGVAGIMGVGLIAASLVMACLDFFYPQSPQQWGQFVWTLLTVTVSGIGGMVGVVVALHYMGDIPVLRRFTLQPPEFEPVASGDKKDSDGNRVVLEVTSGRAAGLKVGDEGFSESVLRPAGRARIQGRSVDVIADGKFIEPDRPLVVVDVRGNRLIVAEVIRTDV